GETGRAGEAETGGAEFERGAEYAEAVFHAAAEVDRRAFGKVTRRAGDLADVKAEPDGLRQHLVVEDEVVRVLLQRKRLQEPAREGAVAGVVLGELVPEEQVFAGGEKPVGDVLPERHSARQRADAENARAEHRIEVAAGDHPGHRRQEPR